MITNRAVVIDNGSVSSRSGFAGDVVPEFDIPTVVGRHKHKMIWLTFPDAKGNKSGEEERFGNQALHCREVMNLKFPIESGIITNWDDMQKFWNFTFYKTLRISPEEHAFLFTEGPLTPTENRAMMTQIMFEQFHIPALNIANRAVMSLYDTGNYSGIVLDSGDRSTYSVPIYDGKVLPHACSWSDLGGRDLTDCLLLLLSKKGYSFTGTSLDLEIIRDIKEKLGYVALNYGSEKQGAQSDSSTIESHYELPDGNLVSLNEERFQTTELLFEPNLYLKNEKVLEGIHEMVYNSIEKCFEIRKDLYGHVVLSGGNTMFTGIGERMKKELTLLAPNSIMEINVAAPPNRNYSSWSGSSLYASLSTFPEGCVTRDEYDDVGPWIIHRKCL